MATSWENCESGRALNKTDPRNIACYFSLAVIDNIDNPALLSKLYFFIWKKVSCSLGLPQTLATGYKFRPWTTDLTITD